MSHHHRQGSPDEGSGLITANVSKFDQNLFLLSLFQIENFKFYTFRKHFGKIKISKSRKRSFIAKFVI